MRKKHGVVMLSAYGAPQRNQLVMEDERLRTAHNHFSSPVTGLHPQHLYITSDEEIKEPCWAISLSTSTVEWLSEVAIKVLRKENWKKIAATTDPNLHKYNCTVCYGRAANCTDCGGDSMDEGVSGIPQDFIQKYINQYNAGTPITEVKMEMEDVNPYTHLGGAAQYRLKLRKDNTVTCHPVHEKKFTEADMQAAWNAGGSVDCVPHAPTMFSEWFKENYPS